MIASIIVLGSAALGAGFVLVWLARPDLRAWIERPKYRFQADIRRFDASAAAASRQHGDAHD